MKKILFIALLTINLVASSQMRDTVYSKIKLIEMQLVDIAKHYSIELPPIDKKPTQFSKIKHKPRNLWQNSYKVLIQINMLRERYDLSVIEPVNITPVFNMSCEMVYEMCERILCELEIFRNRVGITATTYEVRKYHNKGLEDIFNSFGDISRLLNILSNDSFTPSFVFAENLRVYSDISIILDRLGVEDRTIPAKPNPLATSDTSYKDALKILIKIKELQSSVGINSLSITMTNKKGAKPKNIFDITMVLIAELQTLKAHLGIIEATIPAKKHYLKTDIEVEQLMSWNLRKLNLIDNISRR